MISGREIGVSGFQLKSCGKVRKRYFLLLLGCGYVYRLAAFTKIMMLLLLLLAANNKNDFFFYLLLLFLGKLPGTKSKSEDRDTKNELRNKQAEQR